MCLSTHFGKFATQTVWKKKCLYMCKDKLYAQTKALSSFLYVKILLLISICSLLKTSVSLCLPFSPYSLVRSFPGGGFLVSWKSGISKWTCMKLRKINNKISVCIATCWMFISMCRYYQVSLNIGRPHKPYFLDLDTGSDLTWLQCDAPCTKCIPVIVLFCSCISHPIGLSSLTSFVLFCSNWKQNL